MAALSTSHIPRLLQQRLISRRLHWRFSIRCGRSQRLHQRQRQRLRRSELSLSALVASLTLSAASRSLSRRRAVLRWQAAKFERMLAWRGC